MSVDEFKNQAEMIYDYVSARLNASTDKKIPLTFLSPPLGPCPSRGLTTADSAGQRIFIFADEQTSQKQILGVLAHEVGHILYAESDLVGGTPLALTEGIATWAAGDYWSAWHLSASLNANVKSYIKQDKFLSLYENFDMQQVYNDLREKTSEDCLERRDILYTEWAAFINYLIEQYGWEKLHTLFGMPTREERDSEIIIKPPDFQAVYGNSLNQLEAAWLRHLAAAEAAY